MSIFHPQLLALAALFAASTFMGLLPVVKLIKLHEAHHELKQGSAGWLRSISGWSAIAFWLMIIWFLATIIGDWWVSDNLTAAIERSWWRLRVLLEIAAAIAEADHR